ncbi:MAG: hypothetical protein WD266_07855 [Balneolales bacterium]
MHVNQIKNAPVKNSSIRWLYIIAGAIALILIAAYVSLLIIVDAGFIRDQVNKNIEKATGGLYSLHLEDIEYSLLRRSVQAGGISVTANEQVLRDMHADSLPSFRYEFSMSGFRLEGVNLVRLLREDSIEMNSLRIDEPVISLMIDQDLAGDGEDDNNESRRNSLHRQLANQLPAIHINDLQITSATLAVWQKKDEQTTEQVIRGINLEFDNIRVDSAAARDESRTLFSDDVRLTVEGYEGELDDGVYHFSVGTVSASTADAFFQVDSVRYEPTIPDPEFIDRLETRESRNIFNAARIRVADIDYRRLLDHRDILAGSVSITNFLFDSFSDIGVPKTSPSQMPHELVQDLGFYLNIREVNLENGRVIYSERAADGVRPGTITLDHLQGDVQHITNDPDLMTTDQPARISLNTLVEGEGELNLNITMPLLAPDFPVHLSGRLGEMNAELFNSILVDLEGIRIRSGVIDSIMIDIRSLGGEATGSVQAAYRDLEIETLDTRDYTRDLGNEIESFLANNLLLRSSDQESEDESLREGTVENEMDRMEDSFLNYIVDSILDGLLSTMVIAL